MFLLCVCRYTLLGTNMYTLPEGTPAGVYTLEVPENERIFVKKGDIIAINTGTSDNMMEIPHGSCDSVNHFFFHSVFFFIDSFS